MNLLANALLSTVIDLLYALMLVCGLAAISLVTGLLAAEAYLRIQAFLSRRRCWKEIEDARRHLILDEHVAGRRRVGISREHVAGRRAS